MVEVGHHDFEKIVNVTRDQMAGDSFRHRCYRFLEGDGLVVGMRLDLDAYKDREPEADAFAVEHRAISLYAALVL